MTPASLRRTAAALLAAVACTPALADLQRCRAIADDRARLACYDALAAAPAAATPAAPAATAAPAAAAVPRSAAAAAIPAAPAATAARNDAAFGLPATGAQAPQQEVVSRLPGLFEGWDRGSRIRLANGQVWQVADGTSAATALRDPVVRVRRAALGTYVMEIEGLTRTVRVRRVE
jgi:hypothetical protein